MEIYKEYKEWMGMISDMDFRDSQSRISNFLTWLDSNEITAFILAEIENEKRAIEILEKSDYNHPPVVANPDEIPLLGLHLMRQVKSGKQIYALANKYGILPSHATQSLDVLQITVVHKYIYPTIIYIQNKLREKTQSIENKKLQNMPVVQNVYSGDFRGAILNINSTLTKSSQVIENMSNPDNEVKEKLIELLEELKQELSKASPEQAEDAEAVAWAAEAVIEAATSERTNRVKIEITKDGLRKAATNLLAAMPIVVPIAEKIIALIGKFK